MQWIPESSQQAPKIVKDNDPISPEATQGINGNLMDNNNSSAMIGNGNGQTEGYLSIPSTTIGTSLSSDTLTESTLSGPSSPSNLSACTLVGSTGSSAAQEKSNDNAAAAAAAVNYDSKPFRYGVAPTTPLPERTTPKTSVTTKDAGILTHSLPPTVTTTHYTEGAIGGGGGSTVKLLQTHQTPSRKNSNSIDAEITPSKLNTTRHLSIGSVMPSNGGGGQQTPMDRRPSAGANIIPQAALCQHRHSLQLNNGGAPLSGGQGSDTGTMKVKEFSVIPTCFDTKKKNFF